MKRYSLVVMAAGLILALQACGGFIADSSIRDAMEAGEEIKGYLPALDAAIGLVQPQAAPAARTIFPGIATGLPDTPADMWNNATLRPAGTVVARFPATVYIEDFYGEEGNLAVAELREVTDGWGDYQVTLTVYPSLSAAVWYTTEVYRVTAGDTSWSPVDLEGVVDALAFESITTYYFDGRVESREVKRSRWADPDTGLRYDGAYFAFPDTFDGAGYAYAETVIQPEWVAVTDVDDFASETHSTIPSSGGASPAVTAVEFYNKVVVPDGLTHQSKSYLVDSVSAGTNTAEIRTVRIYTIDAASTKKVRARSVGFYRRGNKTWTTTTTEQIDIWATDGVVSYTSEVKAYRDDVIESTVTVSLTETAAGSNSYSGELTVETSKGIKTRKVDMGVDTGVDIYQARVAGARALEFPVAAVDHIAGTADREVVIDDLSGGSFEGDYVGGVLSGTFTPTGGSPVGMKVALSYVIVGDTID